VPRGVRVIQPSGLPRKKYSSHLYRFLADFLGIPRHPEADARAMQKPVTPAALRLASCIVSRPSRRAAARTITAARLLMREPNTVLHAFFADKDVC